jgi:hypothetical protein
MREGNSETTVACVRRLAQVPAKSVFMDCQEFIRDIPSNGMRSTLGVLVRCKEGAEAALDIAGAMLTERVGYQTRQ